MIAREKGLEPLAQLILTQSGKEKDIEKVASEYINEQVETWKDALEGGRDIVAEAINDNADVRQMIREKGLKFARLKVTKIKDAVDEKQVYESYYEFENRVDRIQPHQVLAINRGENENILKVKVLFDDRDSAYAIEFHYPVNLLSVFADTRILII